MSFFSWLGNGIKEDVKSKVTDFFNMPGNVEKYYRHFEQENVSDFELERISNSDFESNERKLAARKLLNDRRNG